MTKQEQVLLAVGAHPDDMDFLASGTIAKFIKEGWDAYYVICTDGSKGSADPEMSSDRLIKLRQDEQREAGKILGLKDIFFFDHPDTELVADLILKEEITKVIRTVKPKIVITMDPTLFFTPEWDGEESFINHTDHRAAGLATMDAVFPLARDRLTFPHLAANGLLPHRVEELWFTGFDKRNHLVDITNTLQKKLQAIKAHVSQVPDVPETEERMTNRAKSIADKESYEYAEAFMRLVMP